MKISAAEDKARAHSEKVVRALRAKANEVAATVLPTVISAAESAGNAMSELAASAKNLAGSLHDRTGSQPLLTGTLIAQTTPILRSATRLAMRNPWLLASAGLAIAAIGYALYRNGASDDEKASDRL